MPDFSGYNWNELSPATTPDDRFGHAMVWDGTRIIMFGGCTDLATFDLLNDTWEFDGTDWNQLSPATSPTQRAWHNMVFDGTDVVLFGGFVEGVGFDDNTWVFDGTTWTDVSPGTSPSARYRHAMAYNGSNVILYGGQQAAVVTKHDTWSWNGSAWTQLTPTHYVGNIKHTAPDAANDGRAGMRMEWDGSRILLFSGYSDGGGGGEFQTRPYSESGGGTWQYASSDWTQVGPATNPAARWDQGICVTDDDQKLLMFGGNVSHVGGLGNDYDDVTFEWDGTDWNTLLRAVQPDRRATCMVWDTINARALLFGGVGGGGGTDINYSDTWEFAPTPGPEIATVHVELGMP